MAASANGGLTSGGGGSGGYGGPALLGGLGYEQYDVWDPQHWMLDGLVDLTYSFGTSVEGA